MEGRVVQHSSGWKAASQPAPGKQLLHTRDLIRSVSPITGL